MAAISGCHVTKPRAGRPTAVPDWRGLTAGCAVGAQLLTFGTQGNTYAELAAAIAAPLSLCAG